MLGASEDVISKAQVGDKYAIYHVVGGGGGHSLKIFSLKATFRYTQGDETEPKVIGVD
jgi:hypothetical protein